MIKVRKYYPSFCEGFDSPIVAVNSMQELLIIPFLQDFVSPSFYKFSISENYIMAEYDKGEDWRVVAIILEGQESINLPVWSGTPQPKKLRPSERRRLGLSPFAGDQ